MDLEILSSLNNKVKESLKLMSREEIKIFPKITLNIKKITKKLNATEFNFVKHNLIDIICELKNNNLTFNYYNNLELFNLLEYDSKLYFNLTNNYYYNNFKIKKLNIDKKLKNILGYHIYTEEIKLSDNSYYDTDPIMFTKYLNLKSFDANVNSFDKSLVNFNLTKLCTNGISQYAIKHISNLKILKLYNGILSTDHFSKDIKLIKLVCTRILDIPDNMSTLKSLTVKESESLSELNLANLNLVTFKIYCHYNGWNKINNICNIEHMTNLKKLMIPYVYDINLLNKSLKKLNLTVLIYNNSGYYYPNIENLIYEISIDHMSNLKKLIVSPLSGFFQINITDLNLVQLKTRKVRQTIPNMFFPQSLKILDIALYHGKGTGIYQL